MAGLSDIRNRLETQVRRLHGNIPLGRRIDALVAIRNLVREELRAAGVDPDAEEVDVNPDVEVDEPPELDDEPTEETPEIELDEPTDESVEPPENQEGAQDDEVSA